MMKANEMKTIARDNVVTLLKDVFNANEAVQFDDYSYAILQMVDDQEIWVEVSVQSKAYKPTKVNPAFDPYEKAEAWKAEKALKEAEKLEKEAMKAKESA